MEKKILGALFLLTLIIMYVGAALLIGLVLTGICMGFYALYNKHPKVISKVGYYMTTLMLVLGWAYISYEIYTNDYCNTYIITASDRLYSGRPSKDMTVTTRSKEEVFIKAWKFYISEMKHEVKNSDDYLLNRSLSIWNKSKNCRCYPSGYEKMDSLIEAEHLYYNVDSTRVDLLSVSY